MNDTSLHAAVGQLAEHLPAMMASCMWGRMRPQYFRYSTVEPSVYRKHSRTSILFCWAGRQLGNDWLCTISELGSLVQGMVAQSECCCVVLERTLIGTYRKSFSH